MAAYTYTINLHQRVAKTLVGSPGMRFISGSINITNYNQTRAAIAEITSKFKSLYAVQLTPAGIGAKPNIPSWDTTATSIGLTVSNTGVELASDTNPGVFHFLAIGS